MQVIIVDKRKLNIIFVILSTCIIIGISIVIILSLKNNVKHERNIEVINYSGNIKLIRDDEEITVDNNTKIKNNDNIITNEESYLTIKFDSDKYLYVDFNTNIIINTNKNNSSETKIVLNEGYIVSEIQKDLGTDYFKIYTPNCITCLNKSVFGLKYEKKDQYINLDYKLIEGNAKVLYNYGLIELEPLHQLSLSIRNEKISYDYNEVYDSPEDYKYNKSNDMFITNYEVDYVFLSDVIDKLIYNHNKKTNRLVCVSSTFNLDDETLYKYDFKGSFDAKISLINKDNYLISGYECNGTVNKLDTDSISLNIQNTTLIKPIYSETNSYVTRIKSRTYEDNVRVNFDLLTKEASIETVDPIYLEFNNTEISDGKTKYNFLGWYEIGKEDILLSKDINFKYIPTHNATIYPKYSDKYPDGIARIDVYDKNGMDLSELEPVFYNNTKINLLDYNFYINDVYVPSDLVEYKLEIQDRSNTYIEVDDFLNEVGNYRIIYNLIDSKDVKSLYLHFSIINYVEHKIDVYNSDVSNVTYKTDKNDTGTINKNDNKQICGNKITLSVNEDEQFKFVGWYSLTTNKLISNDLEIELSVDDTVTPIYKNDLNTFAKYNNNELPDNEIRVFVGDDFEIELIKFYFEYDINNNHYELELSDDSITYNIYEYYNGDMDLRDKVDTTYEASDVSHCYMIYFYYDNVNISVINVYVDYNFEICR